MTGAKKVFFECNADRMTMRLLQLQGKDNLSQRLVNDEKSVLHYYDLFREVMQENITRPLHFEGNAPVSDIKWRTELEGQVEYPAPADFFEQEILPKIDQYERKFADKYKQEKGDEVYEERIDVYTSCRPFPRDRAHYAKIGVDWVLIGWGLAEGIHTGGSLVPQGIGGRSSAPEISTPPPPGETPAIGSSTSSFSSGHDGKEEAFPFGGNSETEPSPLPPPPTFVGPDDPKDSPDEGGESVEGESEGKWVFPWKKVLIVLLLLILLLWLLRSCTGPEVGGRSGSDSGGMITEQGGGSGAATAVDGSGQGAYGGSADAAGKSGTSSRGGTSGDAASQSGQSPSDASAVEELQPGPSTSGSGAPNRGGQEAIPGYDPRLGSQDQIAPPSGGSERVIAEILQVCEDERCAQPRCVIRMGGSDRVYPCPVEYNN